MSAPDLRTRRGVNDDFVANTSISVIPRFRLSHPGRKIFWILVFVLSVAVFGWQFSLMINKYLDFPISVNIEMGFKELDFPAVTICNHNRFRLSQLHLAGAQFEAFIKGVETSSADQLEGKPPPNVTTPPPTTQKPTQSRSKRSGPNPDSGQGQAKSVTRIRIKTENQTVVITSRQGRDTTDLLDELSNIKKSRRRPTTMAPRPTKKPEKPKKPDPIIDTGEEEWKPEKAKVDVDTPVKLSEAAAAVGKYYKPKVNITEKPWYAPAPDAKTKTEEQMAIIMSKIPVSVKSAMGHSITDFIQEIVWNGQKISPSVFKVFQSNMFGNCYTFNAADLNTKVEKTRKPGSDYGLKVTLLLEQDEYMSGVFSPTAGARVVLHEPAAPAFPEDHGLDIHPGTLTSINVKFVQFDRLTPPYGNCTRGKDSPFPGRPILYNLTGRYSIQACERSCRQYYNIDLCQCAEPGTPAPPGTTLCTIENVTCIESVRKQYNNGELKCNCDPPCEEQRYLTSQSSSMWPSNSYLESLKAGMATRGGRIKEIIEKDANSLAENLLKVNIFYEALNYERYQEVSSYGIENLLGDLGGQLGLWLGLTVISFWELVDYVMMLCFCMFHGEKSDRKRAYRESNGDAQEAATNNL